jgi:hypothetical protein
MLLHSMDLALILWCQFAPGRMGLSSIGRIVSFSLAEMFRSMFHTPLPILKSVSAGDMANVKTKIPVLVGSNVPEAKC